MASSCTTSFGCSQGVHWCLTSHSSLHSPVPPQAYLPSTPVQDFPYNFEADVEHHNIWSTIPLTEERVLEVSLAVAPQLCNSVAGCSAPSCGLQEEALFLRLLPADLWNWVVEGC